MNKQWNDLPNASESIKRIIYELYLDMDVDILKDLALASMPKDEYEKYAASIDHTIANYYSAH